MLAVAQGDGIFELGDLDAVAVDAAASCES
jgi:hypothetical protein